MTKLTNSGISVKRLEEVPSILKSVDGQKLFVKALGDVNVAAYEIIQITSTFQLAQMIEVIHFQGDIATMTVASALEHWGQFRTYCVQGYRPTNPDSL